MARAPMGKKHVCGRCELPFNNRQELNLHLQKHPDSEPTTMNCKVCDWPFNDTLALEKHSIDNGHPQNEILLPQLMCDRCSEIFSAQRDYDRHREHGKPCCDALHSKDWKKTPRSGYADYDKPKVVYREAPQLAYDSDTSNSSTIMNQDGVKCKDCKKTFVSLHVFSCHFLSCTPFLEQLTPDTSPEFSRPPTENQSPHPTSPTSQRHNSVPGMSNFRTRADASDHVPVQTTTPKIGESMHRQSPTASSELPESSLAPPVQALAPASEQFSGTDTFVCKFNGCLRSYASEAGLKVHKKDAHGVGSQGLDLHGDESLMSGRRERERLRAEGLSKLPTGSRGGRGGSRGGGLTGTSSVHHTPTPSLHGAPAAPAQRASRQRINPNPGPYHQTSQRNSTISPPTLPTSMNIGGALEMEQAKVVCGKTLRLLLQTNVFIHHDGKMNVGGIDWTRIGVARQSDVAGLFNDMCHLPRKLQSLEYVPAPKTFAAEYTAQYPVAEFESAPARDPAKPGLDIVSISCSEITLRNGRQEVVKIAAVDVLTCRVLISHLVCTDPSVNVADWHSSITGLSSYEDMEDARQAGYKVLNGWGAARSALFKFIDKETIIVGHNLRSELDALRVIHGRSVDIVKVVEKAAQGPLSRAQVSLDSWCRDVANVAQLRTDPLFGRDCIMNAFAAREIGLWAIKNKEQLERVAKQKTKEYQLVMKM